MYGLILAIQLVYVIAWLGVKFGINFTSVVVRMAKIARGEAECNFAILTTTQVKFGICNRWVSCAIWEK